MFIINPAKCTGCETCKDSCPVEAISVVTDVETGNQVCKIDESVCIECGTCKDSCPDEVISEN